MSSQGSIKLHVSQPVERKRPEYKVDEAVLRKYHRQPSLLEEALEAKAQATEEALRQMKFTEKMKFFNSSYTGGFSQYVSSNALRNENLAFSFPKGPRLYNQVRMRRYHNLA